VESPAPAANTATLPASGSTRPDLSYLSSLPSGEEYDPREAERFVRGPCGGPGGQIVGWWYAREGAPAEVGETYVMTRPANVRKGSPKAENGWKNDGPVVCSLHKGDRALLRRAPVGNGVHGLWIPVVAGDLLERR
jgi:hypothetical protein